LLIFVALTRTQRSTNVMSYSRKYCELLRNHPTISSEDFQDICGRLYEHDYLMPKTTTKPFIMPYYYAEACNEFAVPISAS